MRLYTAGDEKGRCQEQQDYRYNFYFPDRVHLIIFISLVYTCKDNE